MEHFNVGRDVELSINDKKEAVPFNSYNNGGNITPLKSRPCDYPGQNPSINLILINNSQI